jgi:CheY-like chemotaxis protein
MLAGTVLLVEDNAVNAIVAEAGLRHLGLDVKTVGDGYAAVAACQLKRYDLVLMDCQLPGLDGFEATRLIRAEEARRALPPMPIVALTANALAGDRERCLAAGMDDHLAKPFTDDDLRAMLRSHLVK